MENINVSYIKYILDKESILGEYNVEALCNHIDFLKDKSDFVQSKLDSLNEYEPVFSLHQKYI